MTRHPLFAIAVLVSATGLVMLIAWALAPADAPAPPQFAVEAPPAAAPAGSPAPAPEPTALRPPPVPIDLKDPIFTVRTQVQQIWARDLTGFRATFLPSIAVSEAAFETCADHVKPNLFAPDFGLATERKLDGHRVVRIKLLGKPVGFHEIDRAFRADRVWCAR